MKLIEEVKTFCSYSAVGWINRTAVFLVKCCVTDGSANSQKVIHELDDVIKEFKVRKEDFNLLISDAASYMCRAGQVLKEIYSILLHVTFLAHLMHNCALKVKSFCKEVDDLIAAVKGSVVKNKSRAADFDVYGTSSYFWGELVGCYKLLC